MDQKSKPEMKEKYRAEMSTRQQSNIKPNYSEYFKDTVNAKFRAEALNRELLNKEITKNDFYETRITEHLPETHDAASNHQNEIHRRSIESQKDGLSNRFPRTTDPLEFTSREHSRRMSLLSNKVQELVDILLGQTQRFHKTIGLLTKSLADKQPSEPLAQGLQSAVASMQHFLDDYASTQLPELKAALQSLLAVGCVAPKLPDRFREGALAAVVQMYEDRIAILEHSKTDQLQRSVVRLSRTLGPMPKLITGEEVFRRATHTIAGLQSCVSDRLHQTSLGSQPEALTAKTQRLLVLFRTIWSRMDTKIAKNQKKSGSKYKESNLEEELQAMREAVKEAKEILRILEGDSNK